MLTLLLGKSGTGKTTRILELIKERAKNGKHSIYLIPEQVGQSAELLCYEQLGAAMSAYCSPLSFRTLAQRIEQAKGGLATPSITDAGRAVFVRRAIDSLADEVKYYHRYRRNGTFLNECAEVISKFKGAGLTTTALYEMTRNKKGGEKLEELSLIYTAYEGVVAGKAIDLEDRITRTANAVTAEMFLDIEFFVDDFDTFTAPEYALIRKLISHSEGMSVSLCCDSLSDKEGGLGLFSPTKNTAQTIIRLAKSDGITVAAPVILSENAKIVSSGIKAVGDIITDSETENSDNNGVYFNTYKNIYEECKSVVAQIDKLARNGAKYSDIVVIARDTQKYAEILKEELRLADIPCFTDQNTTAEHTAPTAFIRKALAIGKLGLNTRTIIELAKTGLTGLCDEQISELENYSYVWKLTAGDWKKPFTLNPNGFGEMNDSAKASLEIAELARVYITEKLLVFLQNIKNETGVKIAKELYLLLDKLGAPDEISKIATYLQEQGNMVKAEETLRSWNLAIEALDSIAVLLGEEKVTAQDFDELFLLLVRGSEVGNVPRSLDVVTITGADRMRLDAPLFSFVIGVAEGDFPRNINPSGLLTTTDREFLLLNGVEMSGNYESRVLLEKMFFYRAMVAASKEMYISIPENDGISAKIISSPLGEIIELLKPKAVVFEKLDFMQTVSTALGALAENYAIDDELTASLSEVLTQNDKSKSSVEKLTKAAMPADFSVTDTAPLKALIGKSLNISPSRIEKYYSCSYSYFLQYVLRLTPRRKAELSPIESGSFVHYILENALKENLETFSKKTDAELIKLADELAQQYIEENIPVKSAEGKRFKYLISRIKANAGKLLIYIRDEQNQSSFSPKAFELEIGDAGQIEPLTLETPTGEIIKVRGKVDRVDVMERDGEKYLRVMDYKTGSKEFDLREVYSGLNLQMLIYMFSICDSKKGEYADMSGAGVLYLMADPTPKLLDRHSAMNDIQTYEVDGLLLDDDMVINSMDKGGKGIYIPVKRDKNGTIKKSNKLADLNKLGRIKDRIDTLIIDMAKELYNGAIDASPLVSTKSSPCEYCDYKTVCCRTAGANERAVTTDKNIFELKMEGGE